MKYPLALGATLLCLASPSDAAKPSPNTNRKNSTDEIRTAVSSWLCEIMDRSSTGTPRSWGMVSYTEASVQDSKHPDTVLSVGTFVPDINGGMYPNCIPRIEFDSQNRVIRSRDKKIIAGADARAFVPVRVITGSSHAYTVFYKDQDQVWDANLRPRKDVDAHSLQEGGPTSGCYGHFIKDARSLYTREGKKIPKLTASAKFIGRYTSPNSNKGTLMVYKDHGKLFAMPEGGIHDWKPFRITLSKSQKPLDPVCD